MKSRMNRYALKASAAMPRAVFSVGASTGLGGAGSDNSIGHAAAQGAVGSGLTTAIGEVGAEAWKNRGFRNLNWRQMRSPVIRDTTIGAGMGALFAAGGNALRRNRVAAQHPTTNLPQPPRRIP